MTTETTSSGFGSSAATLTPGQVRQPGLLGCALQPDAGAALSLIGTSRDEDDTSGFKGFLNLFRISSTTPFKAKLLHSLNRRER